MIALLDKGWNVSSLKNGYANQLSMFKFTFFQVLNSGWNATITSPVRANSQEKPVPSFDGTGAQISGMKSLGPSVRRREKSCQSESASSNAKNMSESSDSEARPVQDFNSTSRSSSPPKSKLGGTCGILRGIASELLNVFCFACRKGRRKWWLLILILLGREI